MAIRKMTKADGTEIGNISDVTIHGYPSPAPAAPNNIELNANHGRRNAGKEAMLYSGQHGYDVAGANIEIKKRKVVGSWNKLTIEKEYDGTTTATTALQNALTVHDTLVAQQQNEDMKRISAGATILVVPTIIGSIYGMNFEYLPELKWE